MDVYVTRKRLAALVEGKEATVRRARSGRILTDLTHELIYARVPEGQRARLLGTISGGDDIHTISRWVIPGIGRRELVIKREKLASVITEAEPWAPPAPPDVAARQAAGRARLRELRGLGGDSAQLALL